MEEQQTFAFGDFVFDPAVPALTAHGQMVTLGRRSEALLALLLRRRGEVVSKAELIEAAWPGLAIEESNLSVQIAQLRKLLGKPPLGEEWIETVPRLGYRFAGEEPAGVMPVPVLAVLPFTNLSGDPEQEYLADGIVEDLITALSRFKSVTVVARNSTFTYKGRAVDVRDVSRRFGAHYVLEGSVRRAGPTLRVTAQLIDGVSGAHVWAQSYDGAYEDVFAVQDRIIESVVSVVEPQIHLAEVERSHRERPQSLAAYDLYLRANFRWQTLRREDNTAAWRLMCQAVALEPDNVRILAGACQVVLNRLSMGWPQADPEDRQRAVEFARRGIALTSTDAESLSLFGTVLSFADRPLGYATVMRALSLNQNSVLVLELAGASELHGGDIDNAERCYARSIMLSPADPAQRFALTGLAHIEMIRGNYEAALRFAERSLEFNQSFDSTHWMLIAANAHLGRMEEARRWRERFEALVPGITIDAISRAQNSRDPWRLAAILEGMRTAGLAET